jgi:hypothetical protein
MATLSVQVKLLLEVAGLTDEVERDAAAACDADDLLDEMTA